MAFFVLVCAKINYLEDILLWKRSLIVLSSLWQQDWCSSPSSGQSNFSRRRCIKCCTRGKVPRCSSSFRSRTSSFADLTSVSSKLPTPATAGVFLNFLNWILGNLPCLAEVGDDIIPSTGLIVTYQINTTVVSYVWYLLKTKMRAEMFVVFYFLYDHIQNGCADF